MPHTRAPRPTDLVALVTFDEEVRENQAVTRDHLGVPSDTPRPLAAAIEQWLHLGRRTWISISGREIRGIATARDLSARTAWEMDTLVDAPGADEGVVLDLLRQAALAAQEAQATHLLLRTPSGSPAEDYAPRAGFRLVVRERLWVGRPRVEAVPAHVAVRETTDADTYARFQVYNRAYPGAAREALAMTVEEWAAVQDVRWVERGGVGLLAEVGGRAVATARASRSGQFTLMAEQDAAEAASALLGAVVEYQRDADDQFALVLDGGAAEEALRRAGMHPAGEYAFFCRRITQPVREEAFSRAGIAITG